ncbi:glycoside hydrolase family 31 protein [Mucilaginibacter limnophilus]|uniref:Glycoside hydrolase family 31 protein n=1 Tax=Mucilaginibacter limnophilus TaxID=1932778 RepID=A0A437MTK0_9SPHI|nr:TIM-barrel domain-containing protein [Mucilaginibacter limnophilus]RVU00988.1 glycoside hydrolase family 31 protein [Mucilaginibacter limnophilus]
MNRIVFSVLFCLPVLLLKMGFAQTSVKEPANGVYKISEGVIEKYTPECFREEKADINALKQLSKGNIPFNISDINVSVDSRGCKIAIPLGEGEQLYGFGLQVGSFNQNGLRKMPIVNDYPLNNLGYTHAPLPFYVSNKGYAILVNTSRYTTFYCGSNQPKRKQNIDTDIPAETKLSVEELYQTKVSGRNNVLVDIKGAKGIEIYVFSGPDMLTAIQRYNLFAGGGALPAMWGLGIKYRVKADFKQTDILNAVDYFREKHIPVNVIGLEPHWQTAAYPCSFVWDKAFFPNPKEMVSQLNAKGLQVNLWEHAFVSNQSPLYKPLYDRSGDYMAFHGLVPDFVDKPTRDIFAKHHKDSLLSVGVSGFKMDECDNSDLSRGDARWSFPEMTKFPSGIDGEQMHQLFGLLYQKTIYNLFKEGNQRTYLDVRSSNAFASPYPVALYSDTYDHKQYIEMISNAGFSGLLWSPEVRESNSFKELVMRSQTAVLSAQALFNSWYLQYPPWLQFDKGKNNRGELLEDKEANEQVIRTLFKFRMSLIPYLYNAFYQYQSKGIPPFRALIVDYPEDEKVFNLSDEYMIGESLLAAPFSGNAETRKVYLPKGVWYNFNTNEKLIGGKEYTLKFEYDKLPLFVKAETILPMARPVDFISNDTQFDLTCYVYGSGKTKSYLFEDDGTTFDYLNGKMNIVELRAENGKIMVTRNGKFKSKRFNVIKTIFIK